MIEIVIDGSAHKLGHVTKTPLSKYPLKGFGLALIRCEVEFALGNGIHAKG